MSAPDQRTMHVCSARVQQPRGTWERPPIFFSCPEHVVAPGVPCPQPADAAPSPEEPACYDCGATAPLGQPVDHKPGCRELALRRLFNAAPGESLYDAARRTLLDAAGTQRELAAEVAGLKATLARHVHHEDIEGDWICPHCYEAERFAAEVGRLRTALAHYTDRPMLPEDD